MSAHDLLIMIGVVLVASIGTQLLAAWLKLPTILPLLNKTTEVNRHSR